MSPRVRSTRLLIHLALSLSFATLWLHPLLHQRAIVPLTVALLWPALAIPSPVPWPRWRMAWAVLLGLTVLIALPLWQMLPWMRIDLLMIVIGVMLLRWAHCPAGAMQQRLMLGIGFVPLVMTGTESDSVWYPILGAPCLLLMIAAMVATEINANIERTPPRRKEKTLRLTRGLAVRMIGLLTLAIGLTTMGLFTLFPRVGSGRAANQSSVSEGFALTGMSEWVAANSFAPLMKDPSPALRVTTLDPLVADPTYMRGGALPDLVRFGDDVWRWTRDRIVVASTEAQTGAVTPLGENAPELTLSHRVELLDPSLRTIFSPPWLVAIEGQGGVLNCEPGERWRFPHRNATWPVYTAHVAPGRSPQTSLSPEERERMLTLPDDMSQRIREIVLNRGITSIHEEPGQRAQAIVHHLRLHHGYTLDASPSNAMNPLMDFIRNNLDGYCEQFASAMTAMCRAMGVPARIVTGFHGGEREEDGSLLFRRSDAHAWVEIWIDQQGWVQMDPTPPAHRSTETVGLMADVADNASGRWKAMVVNYQGVWHRDLLEKIGAHSQRIMVGSTFETGAMGRAIQKMKTNFAQERSLWVFVIMLVLIHLTVYLVFRRWRRLGPPWARERSHHEILLHRIARTLAPKARRRRAGETPAEYLTSVAAPVIEPPSLQALISDYYLSRFSTSGLGPSDTEMLRAAKALANASR